MFKFIDTGLVCIKSFKWRVIIPVLWWVS